MSTEQPQSSASSFIHSPPRPTKTYHTKPYPSISLPNTLFKGQGKTVLITGGASGIGLSTSHAFAKAGISRLILLSRNPSRLASAKLLLTRSHPHLEVVTYSASISDHTLVSSILRSIEGGIDVLVHCAGAVHRMDLPPEKLPMEDLREVVETNFLGGFNLLATFMGLSDEGREGRTFINISSGIAYLRVPSQLGYGASKAAFAKVVEGFAEEETRKRAEKGGEGKGGGGGVRLFNVHPGAFYTDMAKAHVAEDRMVWDDIDLPADYCVWLAGPRSDFLHGRFLWPHWDVDELEGMRERFEREPDYLTVTLVQ